MHTPIKRPLKLLTVLMTACGMMSTAGAATRLMSQPAISDEHIVFAYAEDLWVVNRDGTDPRRLTVSPGVESDPIISPDGSLVAFDAEYDGNHDVYVMPISGGVPKRLTWHPYRDAVVDFNQDGSDVLFTSNRFSHTNRFSQLHTIPVEGGPATELPIPTGFWAAFSDDDAQIAYTPNRSVFNQWKNYRGGTMGRIWVYDRETHAVEEVGKPETGSNDSNPQWSGEHIYFRSDRNGEFNVFSYHTASKAIKQLTFHDDYPVLSLKVHQDTLVYEQAGLIHTLDLNTGQQQTVDITINTDLLERRTRYASGKQYVRSAAISPAGERVVIDFRGEVVTVPVDKGDPNNLTQTPGSHENQPVWSPNGQYVAYFSNRSGQYELHVRDMGDKSVQAIELEGAGFYAHIHWSPDSKKVSYSDNGRQLFITNIDSGKTTRIAADQQYIPGAFRDLTGGWSPDSNWLVYTLIGDNSFEHVYLYSLDQDKSFALSDGLSNLSNPVFDPNGQYLYVLASTDAGPVQNWFDQSSIDMQSTNNIYLVTLQNDVVSPFKKDNDQVAIQSNEQDKESKEDEDTKEPEELRIDWQGISQRIIDVPLQAADYANLRVGKSGELYYTKANEQGQLTLHKYSLADKEETPLLAADAFELSATNSHVLYQSGGAWGTVDLAKDPKKGTPVNWDAVQVKVVPQEEWANIFAEAWQVNRDYFYDPGMHGADWPAMKEKYAVFLPHLAVKSDLYRVMQWMFSELAVGHHRFNSRGDQLHDVKTIKGGLLGADLEANNGRYQITKIYGGLNWNPGLRSPLTEPGVDVQEGDYLLAVNGRDVTADDNLFSFFENTADRITTLTVGPRANGRDSRQVQVTPVDSEYALRNRDWVEGNIKKVDEATDGQVAYVYVPNTANAGHEYFKRYFFPQVHKKAIIVDERYNGGGYLADYVIDLLNRPEVAKWNFRYGNDLKAPHASIQGPKVMIIDENAGSGGDYLPYMFRRYGLGTLVGKTTWGGLVGVLGYPQFIDGGSVSAPNVAFFNEQGFGIENEGVAPDVEVEQWPAQVINGEDPQLDKAIELIKQKMKNMPESTIQRPEYPDRHGLFRD